MPQQHRMALPLYKNGGFTYNLHQERTTLCDSFSELWRDQTRRNTSQDGCRKWRCMGVHCLTALVLWQMFCSSTKFQGGMGARPFKLEKQVKQEVHEWWHHPEVCTCETLAGKSGQDPPEEKTNLYFFRRILLVVYRPSQPIQRGREISLEPDPSFPDFPLFTPSSSPRGCANAVLCEKHVDFLAYTASLHKERSEGCQRHPLGLASSASPGIMAALRKRLVKWCLWTINKRHLRRCKFTYRLWKKLPGMPSKHFTSADFRIVAFILWRQWTSGMSTNDFRCSETIVRGWERHRPKRT